jgi:Peptidase M50B-like
MSTERGWGDASALTRISQPGHTCARHGAAPEDPLRWCILTRRSGIAIGGKGLYVSRMSTTQAWLSGSAAAVVGLAAFGVVATEAGWQVLRHGTVMAHEGAHAVADSLLGRQVDYVKLNFSAEKSGETWAKNEGGWSARVVVAFVGYIGPSSFGLGAAKLIQLGYAVAVLWITLFLLGILLLLLRWSFGLLTVTLAGGLVYVVGRYAPVSAQIVAAYAIAWLLLLSGVRGILVRGIRSGDGRDLRRLTVIPRFIWFLLWLASTLAAVAIGGRWLVMST